MLSKLHIVCIFQSYLLFPPTFHLDKNSKEEPFHSQNTVMSPPNTLVNHFKSSPYKLPVHGQKVTQIKSPFPSEAVLHSETSWSQSFLSALLFAWSLHAPSRIAHSVLLVSPQGSGSTAPTPYVSKFLPNSYRNSTTSQYHFSLFFTFVIWLNISQEATYGKEELI